MFNDDARKKDVRTPNIVGEVWRNGEFIKWNDARVHVMSHVLHYGSSVFEGIRTYKTERGPAIFRLREHIQRLLNSAKIYRMEHPWSLEELCDAIVELVARSGLQQCYVRPIMFRCSTKSIRRSASTRFRILWPVTLALGTGASTSATPPSNRALTCASRSGIA